MKGFVQDIESLAVKNSDFRQVLYPRPANAASAFAMCPTQ